MSALLRLDVLDTPPEEPFENIVALVRQVLSVPMTAVTLVDADRQWFKARRGLGVPQTPRDISFCTHAVRQREPFIVADALLDDRFVANPLVTGEPHIRSYAGVPLASSDGYNVGTLCAIDTKPRDYTAGEIAILANFAKLVVSELELRRIADSDQLTGALSRRGFLARIEDEIERWRRYRRPACVVMVDVDHFKFVNDMHGHQVGDTVLRDMAARLMAVMRPTDVLGRLGGEEFGILLPETDGEHGLAAAERFRQTLSENPVTLADHAPLQVTASFGVAPLTEGLTRAEQWLAMADAPLYRAKRMGRNVCVLA
ncbi:MAG TPA: sensor domain-containing diguanylate cyclase [Novosphingobium sp.]|nr:sensor domain-containing diguanylate cyclase [Novosphingobium sp.]